MQACIGTDATVQLYSILQKQRCSAMQVGAGSVVLADIPAYCVAVGVPARIIKRDYSSPEEMDQCTDFMLDYVI
jgi:serine acetyltransferase